MITKKHHGGECGDPGLRSGLSGQSPKMGDQLQNVSTGSTHSLV